MKEKIHPYLYIVFAIVFLLFFAILLNSLDYNNNSELPNRTIINDEFLCYNVITDKQINCSVEKIEWIGGGITFAINMSGDI